MKLVYSWNNFSNKNKQVDDFKVGDATCFLKLYREGDSVIAKAYQSGGGGGGEADKKKTKSDKKGKQKQKKN